MQCHFAPRQQSSARISSRPRGPWARNVATPRRDPWCPFVCVDTFARQQKSVLITGAAGFIGSHLADRCLQLGWRVIALDSFSRYYPEVVKRTNLAAAASHPSCIVVEGDLLDVDLGPFLQGVSVVFHLAGQPGVRASWEDFDLYTRTNVTATQRLLDAARGASIDRFVVASSSSIYGDVETLPATEDMPARPVSPYGVTKLATEHLARVYCRTFGVPAVCLRYFTVYGPRQRPDMALHKLISCALAGRPFEIFGDGAQTRDFTFVADAVSATLAAADRARPGMAYNVGGGSRLSLNAVLGIVERLAGRPLDRVYRRLQAGDARDTAADIRLAGRELGFEPSFSVENGLAAQLEWQRRMMAESLTLVA